jgi:DNA helicase-2/ATP-dependent DNA helicase PcrA
MGAQFDRFFPGATRYTLSRTFRFGHRLALAAAQLIAHNRNREDTLCVAAPSTPDTHIERIRATADGDQGAVVAAIDAWRRQGRTLREVAVLARLWAQTLGLELALLERGIPYAKAAQSVFEVPEVVGFVGWMRLVVGNLSDEAMGEDTIRHMLGTPTLWLRGPPPAPAPKAAPRPWGLNDRLRHPTFGDGCVVGLVDRDTLDIDFGGRRRKIRLGVVPLERR